MITVSCEKDGDYETAWDYVMTDWSGAWSAPLQNGVTYDIANMYINPVLKYYDIIEQMTQAGATEDDICSSLPIEYEMGWANSFDPSEHQIVTAQMFVGIMYDAEILYGNSWGYHFSKDDTEEVPDETIEVEDSITTQDMETEEESLIESMQQEMPQETIVPDVTVTVVEGDLVYTVKAGDTLGSISANYYGNNAKGGAIREHNKEVFAANKGKLVEGMQLVLPAKLGSKTRIAEPVANEGEALYTVMHGDTLCGIAKKIYGTEAKLAELYARNSDRLSDASKLFPGQVIVLPAE